MNQKLLQTLLQTLMVYVLFLNCSGLLQAQSSPQWVDRAKSAGITATHFDGGHPQQYLPQLMMTGLALFDFDRDGWNDIYLLNGFTLSPDNVAVQKPLDRRTHAGNTLYRNNRDGTFSDVTESAGVACGSFCMGVVAGDFDNDGDSDFVISNYGTLDFYRNNGDGTFS